MPRPPSDPELKAEFSARITELLSRLTAREIAAALRVKRQMVYNYKAGRNAPSPEVIRRAMEVWPQFSLSYRGKILTLRDFERRPISRTRKNPIQYELWDAIKKLDSKSVAIEIVKKETSSVELAVRIHFRNG